MWDKRLEKENVQQEQMWNNNIKIGISISSSTVTKRQYTITHFNACQKDWSLCINNIWWYYVLNVSPQTS